MDSLPAPLDLILKEGAQVMLVKNLDISKGLVNGARGVVERFDQSTGEPIVAFFCNQTVRISKETWIIESFYKKCKKYDLVFKQIPLKLAWATTIHKCISFSTSPLF
jgi:ATP-dependent DNA helicase PIF1